MKPTLLILAAGMGSRYGSLKQLDGVGPSNETIIDYSVYDAIRAGFGKIVFVIREHFAADFKERITQRFSDKIKVQFAYQEVNTPISGLEKLPEREKPWGTGHAILVATDLINEPFAAINSDDYYDRDAFEKMAKFLKDKAAPDHYAMVGFILAKTLSDNGSVSRGVCTMDNNNYLESINERTKIVQGNGSIYFEEREEQHSLSPESLVSMNFWGFHPSVFKHIHQQFIDFVKANADKPKAEFYIPLVVDNLMKSGEVKVSVLNSSAQWFGVTYKEDKGNVQLALKQMAESGKYPDPLWQ